MPARIGEHFGRLAIKDTWLEPIKDASRVSGYKSARFAECVCICGTTITTRFDALRGGRTKSCGCWRIEHGVIQAAYNKDLHNFTQDPINGRFKSLGEVKCK